ncbi:MAG: sigma-70 family RNA polymerase sigma factor [Agarilytica sp.]
MQQSTLIEVGGTDCDLMLYIQLKEDDVKSANLALNVLIRRHHAFFGISGKNMLSGWRDLSGAEAIIEEHLMDTWKKVYDSADSYQGAETNDPDLSRKVFRAWVGTIFNNLILDWLELARNKKLQEYTHQEISGYEEKSGQLVQVALDSESRENGEGNIFSCLSEKEADVMRELLLYLGTELTKTNLPHGAMGDIAKRLNTQPENVRQLKARAIKKIKAKYETAFGSSK